jgi:hypothetical protein
MRQAKVVIGLEQHQLLPQAVLPLAQRGDPTPDCCHTLPDVQVGPNIAKLSFGATAAVPQEVEPPSIVPEVLKPLWFVLNHGGFPPDNMAGISPKSL